MARRTDEQMARVAVPTLRAVPVLSRRALRLLIAVLVVCAAAAGGWFALRDSALVAVEHTTVEGLRGPQAAEVRMRLIKAASGMSTVHLDRGALEAAVRDFPTVRSLALHSHPPHRLTIVVGEDLPVAAVGGSTRRVAAAADGRLLPGVPTRGLPLVAGVAPPSGGAGTVDAHTRAVLAAIAAAPQGLRETIRFAGYARETGVTIRLAAGPMLRLGGPERLRAKWIAIATVLADPGTMAATYIDVRSPERAAAGGLEPVTPEAGASGDSAAGAPARDSTTSAATAPAPATVTQP